jgi:NAD-dependent deacetylase
LSHKPWREAQKLAQKCNLMMLIGSSLEVLPVARLPLKAVEHGAHLIIINQSSTYLDESADIVIHDNNATILPAKAYEVMDAIPC